MLDGDLADRLEHPETLLVEPARPAPDETLVEQRAERVEIGVAYGLSRLDRAAATKGGEPPEETLLVIVEKVVGPGDRRP